MYDLTLKDFSYLFGTTVDDIPDDCRDLIAKHDFRYRVLEGEEQDRIMLDVLKKTESDRKVIGAPERQAVWEKGWSENLEEFIESGYQLDRIVPKFIRPNQPIRLNQQYIMPTNPNFELDYFSVFRLWLFRKYLEDFDPIYEFGCGTGFNLVSLAQLYPEKTLHGLDFVSPSQDLVNKIGQAYGWKMQGHPFDMISPDENFELDSNGAVFTIGTIVELASKFEAFLQFLLKQPPALCIDVLPIAQWYDENNLVDYLAAKFHRKRGYTENYLPRLRELEANGKIEIVKVKRTFCGSLYMEGYSYVVWKPRRKDEARY